jgi:hypothetical protein
MTAREVIILLRSLHRETTWTWTDTEHSIVQSYTRQGCITRRDYVLGWVGRVSWPCETAALLDSIEGSGADLDGGRPL